MPRPSRFVFLTTALALGALVVAAQPASAQQAPLQQALSGANSDANAAAFLVAGMAPSASAAAQQSSSSDPSAEGFGIGFKLGPIFSTLSQANSNFSKNNGFELGIFFGGNRTGTVGVMGEVLYAKKGSKNPNGSLQVDLRYLEVPILLRINMGSRSRSGVSVYGLVGPVFDILMKGTDGNSLDVKKNYESLDLGVLVGAGVEVTRLLIEGRYNIGMKNVLKGGGGNATDIKSRSFALLFGVRFN